MASRISAAFARLRPERGFTMYAVMGAMLAIMILSVTAFAAAGGDLRGARYDQDLKRAYSAAEAGLNYYLSDLNQDNTFWRKCDAVPAPSVVNNYNDSPLKKVNVSGETDAQYAIEMLPAIDPNTGNRYTKCNPAQASKTMINPKTGTFQIRSTGFVRGARRTIVGTFRRKKFLDFLYFTDFETANPVTYSVATGGNPTTPDIQDWASTDCSVYYRDGRGSASYTGVADETQSDGSIIQRNISTGCTEINFITGDNLNGPMHTNDQMLVCGTPAFGRDNQDFEEYSDPTGWRGNGGCGGNSPNFVGKYVPGAGILSLPPSNQALTSLVDPGYTFTGRTNIVLNGGNIIVTNNGSTTTLPFPPNGIVYVESGPNCGVFYDPTRTDPSDTPTDCGDAYVHGPYGNDLTIAAEKDIIIDGNINKTADNMVGLIANNFVRVNHPVTNRVSTYNGSSYRWDCTNNGMTPNQIDAAILALNYSFIVDNWYCGNALGTLTVNGAIAQKYRGIVGTFGSSNTGYLKNYVYDDRLKYREPPHFLDPVQTAWRIIRETEQTPPAGP
jgi:Tfp pilus assembly protein PilX